MKAWLFGLFGTTAPARPRAPSRSGSLMLALEERMMFDGAVGLVVLDGEAAQGEGVEVAAETAPPVVTVPYSRCYVAEQGPEVALHTQFSVTDIDSTTLQGALVRAVKDGLVLSFTDQNGITGTWNQEAGTLTLSGTAAVADYQTALRSVMVAYVNDLEVLSSIAADVTVNDGDSDSKSVRININVVNAEDKPSLNTTEVTVSGTTAGVSKTIYPMDFLHLSDPDSPENATKGIAAITSLGGSGVWSYGNENNYRYGTLIEWTDIVEEVSEQNALFLHYNTALRYTPGEAETGTVSFTFKGSSMGWSPNGNPPATFMDISADSLLDRMTDETGTVSFATLAASVAAPEVIPGNPAMEITEQEDFVPLFEGIVLSDIDSPSIHGATISLDCGSALEIDGLAFYYHAGFLSTTALSERNKIWVDTAGSYVDEDSRVVVLWGDASVADYQDMLRGINIRYTGDAPPDTITATITINDGQYDNALTQQVMTVNNVNDAPVIDAILSPSLPDGSTPGQVWPGRVDTLFNATDADSGALPHGIAITQASGAGVWSWSSDGVTYTDIVNPSVSQSLLLGPTTFLRYTPAVDFAEAATLIYRVWDQSQGAVGETMSTALFANDTPFSLRTGGLSNGHPPPPVFVGTGQVIHNDLINRGDASLGDLDGDGDVDAFIVGTSEAGAVAELWLNDGNASFSLYKEFNTIDINYDQLWTTASAPTMSDIDNDGDLDLLFVANYLTGQASSVRVYRNDGGLAFSLSQSVPIPGFSAVADFNGDGDVDLLSSGMRLWLNDGNGQFFASGTDPSLVPVSYHNRFAAGDIDGDGDLDCVAGYSDGLDYWTRLSLYLNDGTGLMTQQGDPFFLENGVWSVLPFVDLNGDQHLDMMLSDQFGSTITFFNDGSGGLQMITTAPEPVPPGFRCSGVPVFGDFDGDGYVDYLSKTFYGGSENNQTTHRNDGFGEFIPLVANQPFLHSSRWAHDLELADLDGDGDLDAFVGYHVGVDPLLGNGRDPFTIWLNDPTQTLLFPPRVATVDTTIVEGVAAPLNNVTLTDLEDDPLEGAVVTIHNNDGRLELSFVEQYGIAGTWDAVNGTLTLSGAASVADYQAALNSVSLLYNDLSVRNSPYVVSIAVFDGGSTENEPEAFRVTVTPDNVAPVLMKTSVVLPIMDFSSERVSIDAVDFISASDADGNTVGAAITALSGGGTWWYRDAIWGWREVNDLPSENHVLFARNNQLGYVADRPDDMPTITFRAFDGTSSNADATVNGGQTSFSAESGTVSFYIVPPAFTPYDQATQNVGHPDFLGSEDVALFDMDGDGDVDALVSAYGRENFYGHPGRMENWINDGRGHFTLADTWIPFNNQPPGSWPGNNAGMYKIAVGDVDGDGDLDVALGSTTGDLPVLYANDGLGNFQLLQPLIPDTTVFETHAMTMADFNGDGFLDLFYIFNDQPVVNQSDPVANPVTIGQMWLNDGLGFFTLSPEVVKSKIAVRSMEVADVDGDADLDFVLGSRISQEPLQLWRNDGNGRFTRDTSQALPAGKNCDVAMGDVDNDGDVDLFVYKEWLYNDGNGSFSLPAESRQLAGYHYGEIALGDLNGDGWIDMFATNPFAFTWTVLAYINDGNGDFFTVNRDQPSRFLNLPTDGQKYVHLAKMADLDGDGDLDLFLGTAITYGNQVPTYNQVLFNATNTPPPLPADPPPPVAPIGPLEKSVDPVASGHGIQPHTVFDVQHHPVVPPAPRPVASAVHVPSSRPLFMDDSLAWTEHPSAGTMAQPSFAPFQLLPWLASTFGGEITLEITLEDGSPMPEWLAFDPWTGTFSGTPEGDFDGTLSLLVIRRDAFGNEVQELLNIQAEEEAGEDGHRVRVLPAKPAFTAQLRQAAMAAAGAR